jgi:hypothetical protein
VQLRQNPICLTPFARTPADRSLDAQPKRLDGHSSRRLSWGRSIYGVTIGSGAACCAVGVATGGVMVEVETTMLNTIDMTTRTARIPNMMRALR